MPARSWQVALGLVVLAHLIGQWFDEPTLAAGTQVLLVPAVAGTVWSAGALPRRSTGTGLYAAALGFSWLGDWLPPFAAHAPFAILVACFLAAQLFFTGSYVLLSRRAPSWWVVVGYIAVFAGLFLACAPEAGSLLPLVALYGLVLVTAAACSTTVSPLVAIGAGLFVLSDALIALERFVAGFEMPHQDVAVMSTYIAAQVLIAYGMLQHRARRRGDGANPARLPER